MGRRFDLINHRNLDGVAIFQLNYDGLDQNENYWSLLRDKFFDFDNIPCNDIIYDMGGPIHDYHNNEEYIFTIQPSESSLPLTLTFQSFSLGTGDFLKIYNGINTSSPLIGTFLGSNSPGTTMATGNSLTLHFKSNSNGTGAGFKATWNNCSNINNPIDDRGHDGVDSKDIGNNLVIGFPFPQPFSASFQMDISCPENGSEATIALFNSIGQPVFSRTDMLSEGRNTLTFPSDNLSPGMYFLNVKVGDVKKTMKVMKL